MLTQIKGKFLLSSFQTPLLDRYMEANKRNSLLIDSHTMVNSRVAKKKTEVLTANYPLLKDKFTD